MIGFRSGMKRVVGDEERKHSLMEATPALYFLICGICTYLLL